MANKNLDIEAEKNKESLDECRIPDDKTRKTEENLNPNKMLSSILAKQNDMAEDIKSLIKTVAGVQKDFETFKPLVEKVDDLTVKYQLMEKRLTAIETNTGQSKILEEVKALLKKKKMKLNVQA